MASSSASTSCALSLTGPPHAEDDAVAVLRYRHERLVDRLEQAEGAEDRLRRLAAARAQLDAGHGEDDLEVTPQRLADERRGLADHPLEVVVGGRARLERIDDDVHGAPRLDLGLLD